MLYEYIIALIVMLIVITYLWMRADKIHKSHYKTRKDHPTLFKITGINGKNLDNPERWIKHFRISLVVIVFLFLCVIMIIAFGA